MCARVRSGDMRQYRGIVLVRLWATVDSTSEGKIRFTGMRFKDMSHQLFPRTTAIATELTVVDRVGHIAD